MRDSKAQAEYLRVTTKTLANWRYLGSGPPYIQYGDGRVLYDEAETEAWLATRKRRSTTRKHRRPTDRSTAPAAAV